MRGQLTVSLSVISYLLIGRSGAMNCRDDFYDFYGFYDFNDFNDLNGLNDFNDLTI